MDELPVTAASLVATAQGLPWATLWTAVAALASAAATFIALYAVREASRSSKELFNHQLEIDLGRQYFQWFENIGNKTLYGQLNASQKRERFLIFTLKIRSGEFSKEIGGKWNKDITFDDPIEHYYAFNMQAFESDVFDHSGLKQALIKAAERHSEWVREQKARGLSYNDADVSLFS